jgi:hypothetical protein
MGKARNGFNDINGDVFYIPSGEDENCLLI